MSNTFHKQERLCGYRVIAALFSKGHAFTEYPFRVIWIPSNHAEPFPAQILINVSKKKHKKAVVRNLIKRRIREAYRKNKGHFYLQLNKRSQKIAFALIYIGNNLMDYTAIEQKIILILHRLEIKSE